MFLNHCPKDSLWWYPISKYTTPNFLPPIVRTLLLLFQRGKSYIRILKGMWREVSLTGTVSELEAQVGAPEPINGDGQFDNFSPARTITVVEDEGVVRTPIRLSWTQADAILEERSKVRCHLPGGIPWISMSLGHFIFSFVQVSFSHQAKSIRWLKFSTFGNNCLDGIRNKQSQCSLFSLGQR